MTMHAEQLVGAQVTDPHGLPVGTVEQVFRDDVEGTPTWARVRSAKGIRLVPLAGCSMTSSGTLSVPYDAEQIMQEPDIGVDRHISVEQEDALRRYFGLRVPPQPTGEAAARQFVAAESIGGQEWVTRCEERMEVNVETKETARVRLRKYVDTEPTEQSVRVFHEEYEVERVPISEEDQVSGDIGERDEEVTLHEGQPVVNKRVVPVERVRLSVRKVEEDQTVRADIRKERIEIENPSDEATSYPHQMGRDFSR
jgi:stress response protein YsnF